MKNFITFLKFFLLIIRQNPTPQLNVFIISLSCTLLFFIHLKIFGGLILLKSISAHKLFGITLLILSANPPPVIFAQPLIKFFSINLITSLTYIFVGLINSFFKNLFFRLIFFS